MSVRSLGQLTIDMLLKTGSLETDMGRAARAVDKNAKQIQRSIKNAVSGAVAEFAAVAGIGYSIQQAFVGFNGAIDAADKVEELSARLGISAEKISEYRLAAKLTGTDIDALAGSIGKFSKSLTESLDPNSKQAKLFKSLGIEVTDAIGRLRAAEAVLPEVMDRFRALNNETLETAVAMEIFGKSGGELLEFLNLGSAGLSDMGARARELGGIIDGETAAAAAKFRDKTDELNLAVEGLYLQIAADLLPTLTELTGEFTDYAKDGQKVAEVTDTIKGSMEVLGGVVSFVSPYFKAIDDVIQGLSMSMVGLAHSAEGVIELDWDKVKRGWEVAGQGSDLAYFGEDRAGQMNPRAYGSTSASTDSRPTNQGRRSGSSRRGGGPMNMTDGPKQSGYERALSSYFSDADGRAEKARKAGAAEAKKAAEEAKRQTESLAKFAAQAKQAAADIEGPYAAAVEKARQEEEAWRKERDLGNMSLESYNALVKQSTVDLEARRAALEKQQKAPQVLLDTMSGELRLLGMIGPARERYSRQLQNETDMRRAIADSIEAGNKALRDSPDMQAKLIAEARAFADWSIQVEEAAANAEEWAGIVVGSVGDAGGAFANFIAEGMDDFEGFFDELGDIAKRGIADLIRQLMQQKIVIPIQARIMDSLSGAGGGGGIWDSLLGLFKGNGFAGAGQASGNWASLLSNGGGAQLGQLASLFGGGPASAAGSIYGFGNNVGNVMGMAGGAGTGAAGGAAGGAGALSSAIPIIGWIYAGMQYDKKLYEEGWQLDGSDYDWKSAAASPFPDVAVGGALTDKLLQGLGLDSKTASIITGSSTLAKMFGRKKPQIQAQGITGDYGFGGFSGQSYADVKQKGGWFRSDKRWTQYGAIGSDIDAAFDSAIGQVGKGVEQLAKQLGLDVSAKLKNVKVNIGKLQLDSDPEKAREQLEKAVDAMVSNLAGQGVRALGFANLLDDGFAAAEVMGALATTIALVTGSSEGLGRALQKWEMDNITKGVEYFMKLAEKNGTTLQQEMDRVSGVLGSYSSLMSDVQGQLLTSGLNEYQRAALDIETSYRQQVKAANEYAKALGLTGARAEDLAKIEELRAVNMGSLQKQMESERKSILDGLALSEYSPMADREKLDEGLKQLQDAVKNGDVSGAASLSQTVLGLGRNLFASGRDYNDLYGQVTGLVGGLGTPDLAMDDGTTMGDLATILIDLPKNIAGALFATATGAVTPLPPASSPAKPTGGNAPVATAGGSGADILTQIRDVLVGIAGDTGRAGADRAIDRLFAMNIR